jgi:hypothetical protein
MESPPPVSASAEAANSWDRPLVVVPLFVLVALVGGLFESFTLRANVLVLAVGGAFMWLGLTGRAGRRPTPRRLGRGAVWWLVPILSLSVLELATFLRQSFEDFPTLSLIADPFLEGYVARSAAYLAWFAGFWALARR